MTISWVYYYLTLYFTFLISLIIIPFYCDNDILNKARFV
jgi:hypothetical protein